MLPDDVSRLADEFFAARMNNGIRDLERALDRTSQGMGISGPTIFSEMRRQGSDAILALYAGGVSDLKTVVETHDLGWSPDLYAELIGKYDGLVQNVLTNVRAAVMRRAQMFGGAFGAADLDPVFTTDSREARNEAAALLESFAVERKTDAVRKRRERVLQIRAALGGVFLTLIGWVLVAWLTAWFAVHTAPIEEPDFTVVINGAKINIKNHAGTARDMKVYCMRNPTDNRRTWPTIDVPGVFHPGRAGASAVPRDTIWTGNLGTCYRAPGSGNGTDDAYVLLHYLDGKNTPFNAEHEYYNDSGEWYEQIPVSTSAHEKYNALIKQLDLGR